MWLLCVRCKEGIHYAKLSAPSISIRKGTAQTGICWSDSLMRASVSVCVCMLMRDTLFHQFLIRYHHLLQQKTEICPPVFLSLLQDWANDDVTATQKTTNCMCVCVCVFKCALMMFCAIGDVWLLLCTDKTVKHSNCHLLSAVLAFPWESSVGTHTHTHTYEFLFSSRLIGFWMHPGATSVFG